jgi:hypothetical protein
MTIIRFPLGSYSTGREAERLYRAKLAVRLGVAHDDIRQIFDMDDGEIARLAGEVGAR